MIRTELIDDRVYRTRRSKKARYKNLSEGSALKREVDEMYQRHRREWSDPDKSLGVPVWVWREKEGPDGEVVLCVRYSRGAWYHYSYISGAWW